MADARAACSLQKSHGTPLELKYHKMETRRELRGKWFGHPSRTLSKPSLVYSDRRLVWLFSAVQRRPGESLASSATMNDTADQRPETIWAKTTTLLHRPGMRSKFESYRYGFNRAGL